MVAFALTIAASFFWASSQVVYKLCVNDMNNVTFNAIQYSFLAIALTPVVLIFGIEAGSTWAVAMAIAFGISWIFIGTQILFYCLKCAPAHLVLPIGNTGAIWAVIAASLLLGEGIELFIPFSLMCIVVGIILLSPRGDGGKGSAKSAILAVLVAVIFGITQIIRKSAIESGMGTLTLIWISAVAGSSLLCLNAALRSSFRGQRLNRVNVSISVSSGVINHLFGNLCYLTALALEKVSNLAPLTSAVVPLGFLLSVPILGERPTKKAVLGMITVLVGVILATL